MALKITERQLETAARRFLVKCAAAQPRSLEGTLLMDVVFATDFAANI